MRSFSGRNSQWDEAAEGRGLRWPRGTGGTWSGVPGSQRAAGPGPQRPLQPAAQAAGDTESTDDQSSLLIRASA